jgi:hypothetical protein
MIQITAIRLGEAKAYEHITDVRWRNASTSAGPEYAQGNRRLVEHRKSGACR